MQVLFCRPIIFVVICVVTMVTAQIPSSMIGFSPSLSNSCSASLSNLIDVLATGQPCGNILKTVVTSSSNFTSCTTGVGGVNCFDPNDIIFAAQSSKYLVPVYRLPTVQTQCPLCTANSGMLASCQPLLSAMISAAYGTPIDYDALSINDPTVIANGNSAAVIVKNDCNGFSDTASLQVLRYQSEVLCASQDTFNMTLSSAGNIEGILDMRSLMQCGTCAVMPCFPGQLCDGTGEATMCPEGYYCPTTAEKVKCPTGSFCPLGSTEPLPCDGNAAGSCTSEGSARAVTWVPLFISLVILSCLGLAPSLTRWWRRLQQQERTSPLKSKSRLFKSIPLLTDEMSFNTNSSPVSIEFSNITLVTGKTKRISGVSGHIRPNRFTAIIGGSGAGKTSLMNVILGREEKTSGTVNYLSDDFAGKIPSRFLPRIVAFVPQNDVYLREMTVYELIAHSARWRLPTTLSADQINERVEEVLDQLQLQHLRDVQVGGQSNSNNNSVLSPGDKKKVNIALELVAGPNVLFLDEPTTGIDSSSALNVATIVRNLARTGLTCVAVVHQPRSEIFSLIDDMIILIRGGYVAYQGPTAYVMAYFAQYGLQPGGNGGENDSKNSSSPQKANKTDFLIDTVSKPPPGHLQFRSSLSSSRPSAAATASADGASLRSKNDGLPIVSVEKAEEEEDVEGKRIIGVTNHTFGGHQLVPTAEMSPPTAADQVNDDGDGANSSFTWADLWNRDGELFLRRMEQNAETAEANPNTSQLSDRSTSNHSTEQAHIRHPGNVNISLQDDNTSKNDEPVGAFIHLHPDTTLGGDVESQSSSSNNNNNNNSNNSNNNNHNNNNDSSNNTQNRLTSWTIASSLPSSSSTTHNTERRLQQRRDEARASNKTFVPLDVTRPGFFYQLYLNWIRGSSQHFKDRVYVNDLVVHLLGGIIMGIATCGGPLLIGLIPPIYQGSCPPGAEVRCNVWVRFEVGPATFLVTMILGSLTIPIAVRTFGREKEIFAREAAVGANTWSYFLGKVLSDLPFLAVHSFVYMAPILAIAPWQAPAASFYAIMLCISLTVTALGYCLSLIFRDPDDAVLTGVIFAILLNLFSGFVPTIGDGPIGLIMYTHWAARAITVAELIDGQDISVADFNQIVGDNWKYPDYARDLGNMVLIASLLLVASLGLILYQNRHYGKLG